MDDLDRGESGHIVVDGATGYLGTHLTHKLIYSGFAVKCIVHPGSNRKDAEALRKMGAEVYIGSFDDSDEKSPVLQKAFAGAVAAVHLIGSVAPKKGEKLKDLHVTQTEWFMYHAQVGNVGRVVTVTTLGTAKDAPTVYQSSKWEAEEVIRSGPIPYTILRPALLVGRMIGNRDSKLVKRYIEMIEKKAFVPVIAGGHGKVQPIFVGDVVNAICRCIFPGKWQRTATGRELELGGPDIVEMRGLVQMLMEVLNIRKPIVAVPAGLATMVAFCCENYQNVPTVSRDQVKLSLSDNICHDNALNSVLGIEPTSLRAALETYALSRNRVVTGAKS